MALSIVNGPTSFYDATVQDNRPYELFAKAQDGSIPAVHRLDKEAPQLTVTAKTTDNSAASQALDLTDQGVTFPAGTFRKIRFKSTARTDNDVWLQEWEQWVWGNDGTTPKLVGSARLLNAVGHIAGTVVQYGNCRFHGTTSAGTVTAGTGQGDVTAGMSLGTIASGVATLTHPIARSPRRVDFLHFSEDAAAVADTRLAQLRSATSTTMTLNTFDVQNATPAISTPVGTNNIDIGLFLLPPPSIELVMNSNNVEVHVGHDATDDVYHDVEVFIGPAEARPAVAD